MTWQYVTLHYQFFSLVSLPSFQYFQYKNPFDAVGSLPVSNTESSSLSRQRDKCPREEWNKKMCRSCSSSRVLESKS